MVGDKNQIVNKLEYKRRTSAITARGSLIHFQKWEIFETLQCQSKFEIVLVRSTINNSLTSVTNLDYGI